MAIFWRTTDLTRWGVATSGGNLSATMFDLNNWFLLSLIQGIQDHTPQAVSIDYFTVAGDQMTIHMTDHTTRGPFTLPVSVWHFTNPPTGAWLADTLYFPLDVFTIGGSVYIVLRQHISAGSFDPAATDGSGHLLYGLLLTTPAAAIPTGGAIGQSLTKSGSGDFQTAWTWDELATLHDVTLLSPHLNGQVLTWDAVHSWWTNKTLVVTFSEISDISLGSPLDSGDLLSFNGTHWINLEQSSLVISYTQMSDHATAAQNRQPVATALGTSSPQSLDPTLGDVFTLTPTGDLTINAASAPVGADITLVVTTSGTSTHTITFGSNFKTTGTLATGAVSGKVFTVNFMGDGTNLNERSRTVAM